MRGGGRPAPPGVGLGLGLLGARPCPGRDGTPGCPPPGGGRRGRPASPLWPR